MRRILVTGADGFIGSHLVEDLLKKGYQVKAFVYYNSFNSWGWIDTFSKDIKDEIEIFTGDIKNPNGVTQNLVRNQKKLADLKQRLSKDHSRGRKSKVETLEKQIHKILSSQFMADIIKVQINEKGSRPDFSYSVDHSALRRLSNERLGKTLLATDQLDWSPYHVIESYRHLAYIEETFKNMKNLHFLRWQPAFHWTDQNLRVHGFYCVLALLLCSLAHKTVQQAGVKSPCRDSLKTSQPFVKWL